MNRKSRSSLKKSRISPRKRILFLSKLKNGDDQRNNDIITRKMHFLHFTSTSIKPALFLLHLLKKLVCVCVQKCTVFTMAAVLSPYVFGPRTTTIIIMFDMCGFPSRRRSKPRKELKLLTTMKGRKSWPAVDCETVTNYFTARNCLE